MLAVRVWLSLTPHLPASPRPPFPPPHAGEVISKYGYNQLVDVGSPDLLPTPSR